MSVLKGILKYAIILILGVLLAFFIAWVQYEAQDLSASVLSITEQDFFESTKWNAGYKKEGQIFEVFLAEQVRNEGELTISVLYSTDGIEWFIDKIDTIYSVNVLQQSGGNLILKVDGYEHGDLTQGLFELPYSGDSRDLTLEYIKSEGLDFAIGNLDNIGSMQSH